MVSNRGAMNDRCAAEAGFVRKQASRDAEANRRRCTGPGKTSDR